MARIAGVNLPNEKRVEIGLTYVFGIGRNLSKKILETSGIDLTARVKNLSDEDVNKLRGIIEKDYKVEGELKREVLSNIKRLKEISAYRGTRHARGLPARGQRTKTNNRTVRGNVRKTATSGKKRSLEKT
ncbi:30S ribosomal protein S13 [Candidatus Falkowbacteria bacterium]|nr:30S ribosomal protein S13 [Candidatus Falkowbacteria bacterium]